VIISKRPLGLHGGSIFERGDTLAVQGPPDAAKKKKAAQYSPKKRAIPSRWLLSSSPKGLLH